MNFFFKYKGKTASFYYIFTFYTKFLADLLILKACHLVYESMFFDFFIQNTIFFVLENYKVHESLVNIVINYISFSLFAECAGYLISLKKYFSKKYLERCISNYFNEFRVYAQT